jgi:hypothetical protein
MKIQVEEQRIEFLPFKIISRIGVLHSAEILEFISLPIRILE